MSVIISGTPNYLRYNKTQKLIIPIVTELQACGPYGFENYVDMTEKCLRSITNNGTWILILVPTYLITHKYRGSQQFSRVNYSTQIY